MADQTEYKEPKLHFANAKGEYVAEYMPSANFIFMDWFRWKYIGLRVRFDKDVYYWHIRHTIDPFYRKSSDIEFIRHVIKEHDQNPTDPVERRHYKRAWRLYGHEMKFVTEELAKDEGTEWEDGEFTNGHAYAYGYKKQWFNKFPEPEDKLMYHGLSWGQYRGLLELLQTRAEARRKEYCEQHGLDPETGEKLGAKKKRKSRLKTTKPGKSLAKVKKSETS